MAGRGRRPAAAGSYCRRRDGGLSWNQSSAENSSIKTLLALIAAASMATACTSTAQTSARRFDPLQGGYASPQGAAFMGYHGPVYREDDEETDK